ncbi:MAG: 1-deoxy-D-xylulose-5-phosphate reductoisomerase, partial [Marinobacter sp.]|nr:1-deoxy-D-xylulose-5-phosphate reductoisomerase [Marinobacter sp.]
MRHVTILGATGSIGLNTLDVNRRHPDRFRVYGLAANTRVEEMAGLCREFRPQRAVMADAAAAENLAQRLSDLPEITVLQGEAGLCEVAAAESVDTVMA